MPTKIHELHINVHDKNILVQQSPNRLTMVEYQKHNGNIVQMSFDPTEMIDLNFDNCGLSPQADLNDQAVRLRIYLHARAHYRKAPLILKRA